MPWLVKNKSNKKSNDKASLPNILLVHIPRCGGTALTKGHDVPSRAISNAKSWLHRCGMRLFFYTYYLWETDNFPLWTQWNALCLAFVSLNGYLRFFADIASVIDNEELVRILEGLAGFNIFFGSLLSAGLSVIFVAPNYGRVPWIRKAHMIMVQYLFLKTMDSKDVVTGMTIRGWILHLTAHKMLNYGYVTPDEFESCVSMAIVRNPYRRMVSMYMYNRFGPKESFPDFVNSWYTDVFQHYRNSGVVEEWETPCHAIPQFEYTHFDGVQLVQSIVKHEEMDELESPFVGSKKAPFVARGKSDESDSTAAAAADSSVQPLYDLPFVVKDAFVGLPRVNLRTPTKPWYEYYDQETLNKTYEMYKMDFAVFGYPNTIAERPDLKPPPYKPINLDALGFESLNRNVCEGSNQVKRSFRKALLTKAAKDPAERTSMGGFQRRVSVLRMVGTKKDN